ncbi:MAG: homoserine kinase, partial [Elusimicrobiota bacterium]|nr:homoserine kinase [Elusimicrobiota bacterium]
MKNKIRVKVPATTSNLGAGFDVFGAALTLYNEFEVELVSNRGQAGIFIKGEGADKLPSDSGNFLYFIMQKIFKKFGEKRFNLNNLKISISCNVPLSSGLGSSAAAIVGGAALANSLCGSKMSDAEIAQFATDIEGHPDNAFPAVFGGICLCYNEGGKTRFHKIPSPKLKLIIASPAFEINTSQSRKKLPKEYKTADAVFNISRAALLTASLYSKNFELLRDAVEDKMHQPYRLKSISKSKEIFEAAMRAGAKGVFISGSGPSIAAFAESADAVKTAEAMSQFWRKENILNKTFILDFDGKGM